MRKLLSCFVLLAVISCQPDVIIDTDLLGETGKKVVVDKDGIEYQLTREFPEDSKRRGDVSFFDFGRAAFGQPVITVSGHDKDTLYFSIGECIKDGRVDANPGQFRRYRRLSIVLQEGKHTYLPKIERDPYGSVISGFSMPDVVGEVTPFRYLELEEPDKYPDCKVSRIMVTCPFDDNASQFESDNVVLNNIWEFCKYSIKATSFSGYYIDGDRERTPYEADALINQLGHYAVDSYYQVARRTIDYLLDNPTWPTEWILQTIILAWNDYLFTGSKDILSRNYDLLKLHALFDLVDPETHLLTTTKRGQPSALLNSLRMKEEMRDIVDWPHGNGRDYAGEDDGFVYSDFNAVVNAFHYKAVLCLSQIAHSLGREDDANMYAKYAEEFKHVFNDAFFDEGRGVYVDGVGVSHASLHSNMFPVALGLVPSETLDGVMDYICSRGMACSVYGAQFLLQALYKGGRPKLALDYITSSDKRSWQNMMREGSTISMEAWGNEFKPNQDWNHAWGAAPASIIPFCMLGITPLEPGGSEIEVCPQIAGLNLVRAVIPTAKGKISCRVTENSLSLYLPPTVLAKVRFPAPYSSYRVLLNGVEVETVEEDGFIALKSPIANMASVVVVND